MKPFHLVLLLALSTGALATDYLIPGAIADSPVAEVRTELGSFYILLHDAITPETVANFIALAESGFYDGIGFHRVVEGHVIQAGCPLWDTELAGSGGPGYSIPFENAALTHLEGAVGMARSADPNSAGSQFYVCLAPRPHLDGDYVVFGSVIAGMEIVHAVEAGTLIETVDLIDYAVFRERALRRDIDDPLQIRPRIDATPEVEDD
ncbi:MAG: peptidylprolyl isomerase [Candidatus Coatesbacteria bacterium]|nr:peptidylprolyl isomerase [Candidatus Coatesbacteria bacterium]